VPACQLAQLATTLTPEQIDGECGCHLVQPSADRIAYFVTAFDQPKECLLRDLFREGVISQYAPADTEDHPAKTGHDIAERFFVTVVAVSAKELGIQHPGCNSLRHGNFCILT
jgi:hypothetical protein